jgi:hypothetical protein
MINFIYLMDYIIFYFFLYIVGIKMIYLGSKMIFFFYIGGLDFHQCAMVLQHVVFNV